MERVIITINLVLLTAVMVVAFAVQHDLQVYDAIPAVVQVTGSQG